MLEINDGAVLWSHGGAERSDRPLVIMMHGFSSNERDPFSLVPALPREAVYASLRAPLPGPGGLGYSWFPMPGVDPEADHDPNDPRPAIAAAEAVLRWLDRVNLHPTTVSTFGFSQGGAMAIELLRAKPELFLTTANVAGFVVPGERPEDAAIAKTENRVFWGHGDADAVIPPEWEEACRAWLTRYTNVQEFRYAGLGHSFSDAEIRDWTVFFRRFLARRDG